jgi:hypothetical protein
MCESSVVLFVKGRANCPQLVRLGELLCAMPVAGRRERAHCRTLRVGQQSFVDVIVIRAANKSHACLSFSLFSQRQHSAPEAEADDAAPSGAPAPTRFLRTVRAASRRFPVPLWAASRTRVSSISMKRDPRIALTNHQVTVTNTVESNATVHPRATSHGPVNPIAMSEITDSNAVCFPVRPIRVI